MGAGWGGRILGDGTQSGDLGGLGLGSEQAWGWAGWELRDDHKE